MVLLSTVFSLILSNPSSLNFFFGLKEKTFFNSNEQILRLYPIVEYLVVILYKSKLGVQKIGIIHVCHFIFTDKGVVHNVQIFAQ